METRRAKRSPISLDVKIKIDANLTKSFSIKKDFVDVKALDISILGIGLLSKIFIPKGVIINLELKLGDKTIDLQGEIRSAVSGGKGLTRLGIMFININEEQKAIIDTFIKENERRGETRLNLS